MTELTRRVTIFQFCESTRKGLPRQREPSSI
nr:MAG TPA: hypothetical protein [Caudoviricetes sp.]